MLFYDIEKMAWIRKPGSTIPAWNPIVLPSGAVSSIDVTFVKGYSVEEMGNVSSWTARIRAYGDYTGTIISETTDPVENGDYVQTFSFDLNNVGYFVTNPAEDILKAVIQIHWVAANIERKTIPLTIFIQNDYLQDL